MNRVGGLKISVNGDYGIHVLFRDLSLGTYQYSGSLIQYAADIRNDGASGFDAVTRINSAWYAIFLISDGTNVAVLISCEPENPLLPSGWSYFMLVGFVYRNDEGAFVKQLQVGRTVQYENEKAFVVNDTTHNGLYTSVSLDNVIPPLPYCWEAEFHARVEATYSATGLKGIGASIRTPLMLSGESRIINDSLQMAVGPNQRAGKNWSFVNEGARSVYWMAWADTGNLTQLKTCFFVSRYKILIPGVDY